MRVFTERIRTAIKATGLSFKEAAQKARITEKTLRNWVQRISIPRIDQFSRLVVALGINPFYILTGEGDPLIVPGIPPVRKAFIAPEEEILRERHRHLISLLEMEGKGRAERALTRVLWGLLFDVPPDPEDTGFVCLAFSDEPEAFLREVGKDWSFTIPADFSPSRELRIAAMDLADLCRKDLLPSLCPVHERAFWTGCSLCRKTRKTD